MVLDHPCQFLEELRGGAPATRAGGHHRGERAQAHGLQQFLRHDDFLGARGARLRGQRDADGVADAFLQQHAERCAGRDDTLAADAGLGQAQVQGEIAARGQVAIDRDQFLHAADLGAEHDTLRRQTEVHGTMRGIQRGADQRLTHDSSRIPGFGAQGVLVHQLRGQRLVQRAPVGADAHRLRILDRELDQLRELGVALLAEADVARVDPVLAQRLGARGLVGQQGVSVVVEVADDRNRDPHHRQLVDDARHRGGGLGIVHGHPHQFRAGPPQFGDLPGGRGHVGGVGIGHRLHDDRCGATDLHAADLDLARGSPIRGAELVWAAMRHAGILAGSLRRSSALPLGFAA